MLIDPYKSVNKNVKVEKMITRTDKIVNEVIDFLIENWVHLRLIRKIEFLPKKL